jgi:uncharacterized repeat protein (TIGR03803 family)
MRSILPGIFALGFMAAPASAATFATIYGFAGGGANPVGVPLLGDDGALYGTTANGGASYSGAVYRLVPPASAGASGTGSVIYSFAGGTDGQEPLGNLHKDGKGNLYGTTYLGGADNFGTVYEISPPVSPGGTWTKTTLYQFTDGSDGANPRAGLTGCGSALCGITTGVYGVAGSYGTVFALTRPTKTQPSWQLSSIYNFAAGDDGSAPYARLLHDKSGNLFGTASGYLGGTGNAFGLTPPASAGGQWTHTVLHDFPFGSDGYTPLGGLIADADGALYGTTVGGGTNNGGTVFRLTPPASGQTLWTEDILASFPAGTAPEGAPAFGPGGLLYVTASGGGINGYGSVLALKRSRTGAAPWTVSVVHNFAGGADGENPVAGFAKVNGVLYGSTTGGNDTAGTVFMISN